MKAVALVLALLAVQDRPVKELAKEIAKDRDKVDVGVFDELAAHGDEESFKALEQGLSKLKKDEPRTAALRAFRLYAGKGELEGRAVLVLEAAALQKPAATATAAAESLIAIGEPSLAALQRVLRASKIEAARSAACDALAPALGAGGDPEKFQLLLAHATLSHATDVAYLGISARDAARYADWTHREVVRATLAADDSPERRALLFAKLHDPRSARAWKLVLLEILADRDGADVDEAVERVLADGDPTIVLEAIALVGERLDEWEAVEPKLRPLMDHRDVAVRRAAIVEMGRRGLTDPEWQAEALELARSRDASHRMGAAAALAQIRTAPAMEALHALLVDKLWSVRVEALEQTVRLRKKESVPVLIERFEEETGRFKADAYAALRLLTGLDLGRLPASWRKWWEREGAGFELPTYGKALHEEKRRREDDAAAGGTRATQYFGVHVESERVVFVLDISGSMRLVSGTDQPDPGERELDAETRMDVAKRELMAVLRLLPEDALFNVVFFESKVTALEKKLIKMKKATRQKALRFVSEQYAVGSTALYPALELAFADPLVDTIYLLSDGAPTEGEITDVAEIRAQVRRWNSARHVRIHGVAMGQESTLLRWLTEDTGGRYLRVD